MTDRIKGFTIALERDIREDDIQSIQTALKQIKGVMTVTPEISTHSDWIAEERAKHEISKKFYAWARDNL